MSQPSLRSLEALQRRVADAVRELPGATALYLFGSRLTVPDDPYADLDLQILTNDLTAARGAWPHILERVAPVRVAWPITPAPDNTAFAILFEGESLYHKVDIGLGQSADQPRYAAPGSPYRALWEQAPAAVRAGAPATRAFLPAHATAGHALVDDLIGSVRYVKARRRSQPLTCWRFARGKPGLVFQLYAEQQRGWAEDLPPLSTWDYKALDQRHDAFLGAVLERLDWSAPRQMDAGFTWLTAQVARLLMEKAAARREAIPPELAAEHLAFLEAELIA